MRETTNACELTIEERIIEIFDSINKNLKTFPGEAMNYPKGQCKVGFFCGEGNNMVYKETIDNGAVIKTISSREGWTLVVKAGNEGEIISSNVEGAGNKDVENILEMMEKIISSKFSDCVGKSSAQIRETIQS